MILMHIKFDFFLTNNLYKDDIHALPYVDPRVTSVRETTDVTPGWGPKPVDVN